jgi:hypothetical protein
LPAIHALVSKSHALIRLNLKVELPHITNNQAHAGPNG